MLLIALEPFASPAPVVEPSSYEHIKLNIWSQGAATEKKKTPPPPPQPALPIEPALFIHSMTAGLVIGSSEPQP